MGNAHSGTGRKLGGSQGDALADRGLTIDYDFAPREPTHREVSPGPVDITKPRKYTDSPRFRPRATTEGHAGLHSPPFKQISMDVDFDSNGDENDNKRRHKKLPTIFKYSGTGRDVAVAGTFNNWQKLPMVKSHKDFIAIVNLEDGDHEYKFCVDGQWINDTATPVRETENGHKNNLIHVQKEDFNAYDALDMDSKAVSKHNKRNKLFSEDFAQTIPTQEIFHNRSGPPILPPHLLQVILNKDTPLSCEPTLLPEPNHVMLNHLYALSIKDGVMVLSSTQRYRKKYVTTLLYKPMGTRVKEQ